MDPQNWMNSHWPNCKITDENWTFKRYNYPEFVCKYIRENWVKVSEEGGGTYYEPNFYDKKFSHLNVKETVGETKDEKENAPKEGQEFAQAYKETSFYENLLFPQANQQFCCSSAHITRCFCSHRWIDMERKWKAGGQPSTWFPPGDS